MKNYQKAIDDAEMCIKLKPDWSKGYFRKGKAQQTIGKRTVALLAYQKGIEFDPNNDQLKKEIEDLYQEFHQMYERQKTVFNRQLVDFMNISEEDVHSIFKTAQLVNNTDGGGFEVNCAYCLGVIYNSVECDQCNTPYCKRCVDEYSEKNGGQWSCPKNCQSNQYRKLNRMIQNYVNNLRCKCTKCNKEMTVLALGN